jgi:hypothetical protein
MPDSGVEALDRLLPVARRCESPYRIMVATARWVYHPAVVLALIGLVALLWGTEDRWILVLGSLGIVAAAAYAAWRRPEFGAD